jgi:glycosyltransferase involved in cell wall biosynthesis
MSVDSFSPSTILFVHSSDEMYGADRILLQIVERLNRRKFRPVVVLPNDVPYDGTLSKALQERSVKTIRLKLAVLRRKYFTPLGMLLFIWRLFVSTFTLVRLVHQESVDIVHSHTSAVISGSLAAWLTGRPHVWQILEIIVHPRFLWRLVSWLMPRLSDKIVAASGPTRDHLCVGNARNRDKAIVIHNGVDVQRFERAAGSGQQVRTEWGIEPNQALVGMIGRISHFKGQRYFVEVASLVLSSHPLARFAIVGGVFPGQEILLDELKSLISQLNLNSKIIVSDFRADVPAVLDAYDVFVLPSTLPDPFPTTVLEAMAAGKPVVANAHGGSIEMIEHQVTGFLVKPNQPEEMAAAINSLLNDPIDRREMGLRGRERLVSHFSLEAFTSQWASLYESLVSSP